MTELSSVYDCQCPDSIAIGITCPSIPMYLEFFGLRELPFTQAPTTEFLIELAGHRKALDSVLHALELGETFVKLTGDAGTGKTLLLQRLQEKLGAPWFVLSITNPLLTADGLLLAVAQELGLAPDADKGRHLLLADIRTQLRNLKQSGSKVVVLVDEAQVMPAETLEMLRLLSNFDDRAVPLLQIVLAGTSALDVRLQGESLRALQQRIGHTTMLPALQPDEIAGYINQRLARAGFAGLNLFNRAAVEQLHAATAGIPRLVNMVAHKALLVAYGRGDTRIGPAHVLRALEDTTPPLHEPPALPPAVRSSNWLLLLLAMLAGSVLTIIIILLFFWPA